MKTDENEYLGWLEEQAEKWEECTKNYHDWGVGHKFIADCYALAIKSSILEFKAIQHKKGESK